MSTSSRSTVALVLLSAPLLAFGGVVADKRSGASERPATGGYVLRCWQDGRLILEENHVSAPLAGEGSSTKLQLLDRHRAALYVAETRNATCLVRARPPAKPRSVLP
jgi:hypothetical protein